MSIAGLSGSELVTENSYGAHLLVDFKPIDIADKLLQECQLFVQQAQTEIYVLPVPSLFIKMTGVARSWRARNRDDKLASLYRSLEPKMVEAEKVLRNIIVDVAEKKNALRIQAKYLSVRLTSCLHHNKSLLDSTDNPVDELREQINSLSNEAAMLKGMLAFNKEVLRIRKLESINREKQSFLRWGQKLPSNLKKGINDNDLADDPDHTVIESRLDLTRQIRVKFLNCLQVLLEKRSIEQFNLDNCEKSLHLLASIVNRPGVTEPTASADEAMGFDHSRCSDCSYGYSITCDCTNHMTNLQKQGQDANDRLRELVVMREKMADVSAPFIGLTVSNGNTSSESNESASFGNSPPTKGNVVNNTIGESSSPAEENGRSFAFGRSFHSSNNGTMLLGQKLSSPGDNNGSTNSNTVNNNKNSSSRSNSSSNAVDTDFVQVHTLEEGDVIVGSTVEVEEEEEDTLK